MNKEGRRTPPKPPWFDNPGKKRCRWCQRPTPKGRNRWHKACLHDYKLIFWPEETRRFVFERDQGTCQGCGALLAWACVLQPMIWIGEIQTPWHRMNGREWHVDHIVPLVDFDHREDDPLAAWRMSNLQLLCLECHKAKTAREARARTQKE